MMARVSELLDDVVRAAKTLGWEEDQGSSVSLGEAEVAYLAARQRLDAVLNPILRVTSQTDAPKDS